MVGYVFGLKYLYICVCVCIYVWCVPYSEIIISNSVHQHTAYNGSNMIITNLMQQFLVKDDLMKVYPF